MKITERGWAGHFICADRCRFRRNTLLEHRRIKIVVSSVGLMQKSDTYRREGESIFEKIGVERYYETMAFHANKNDKRYFDADVTKEISFRSEWSINIIDADDLANVMHDNVVKEIKKRLLKGEKFNER